MTTRQSLLTLVRDDILTFLNCTASFIMCRPSCSLVLQTTTTEQTEHLHIDFAKDAYRATNHKDEYKQMTMWLERREKVQQHAASIRQQQHEQARAGVAIPQAIGPPQGHHSYLKMAKHPTINSMSFNDLDKMYGADHF